MIGTYMKVSLAGGIMLATPYLIYHVIMFVSPALTRKEKMARAGGQLIGAAFAFISEMFPEKDETEQTIQLANTFKQRLSDCLEPGENGELKMSITLPDASALNNLAHALARMANMQ